MVVVDEHVAVLITHRATQLALRWASRRSRRSIPTDVSPAETRNHPPAIKQPCPSTPGDRTADTGEDHAHAELAHESIVDVARPPTRARGSGD